jgi:hypothetical protein
MTAGGGARSGPVYAPCWRSLRVGAATRKSTATPIVEALLSNPSDKDDLETIQRELEVRRQLAP